MNSSPLQQPSTMESALDSLGKPVQQAPYDEIPTAFLCDGQMPAPGQEEEVKQDFNLPRRRSH